MTERATVCAIGVDCPAAVQAVVVGESEPSADELTSTSIDPLVPVATLECMCNSQPREPAAPM